jgi:hypothetical protein
VADEPMNEPIRRQIQHIGALIQTARNALDQIEREQAVLERMIDPPDVHS